MKRRKHSVRSNDRTTVQRFDLQEHGRHGNHHLKSGLDAYEACEGPRARKTHDLRILDVIPPDEYVQKWLARTVRETNGRSAIGPDSNVQNCWSISILYSYFPYWYRLFACYLTFSSKLASFRLRAPSAASWVQAISLGERLRFKTVLHKPKIREVWQQDYRVQLR